MIEEIFFISGTATIIVAVGLALGLYVYVQMKHRASNPSMALILGISGVATGRNLPSIIILYESTITLLMLALLYEIVFESALLYKVFEIVSGVSLLTCSLITLQNFRRVEKAVSRG